MSALDNLKLIVRELRPHIAVCRRNLSQSAIAVNFSQDSGQFLQSWQIGADLIKHFRKQLLLDTDRVLLGMENGIFLFFQFGGDETFRIGQSLFSDIAPLILHLGRGRL